MEKLKNTRILGSIGLVACFLGTILPFITFSLFGYSQSISLWGYWEGKVIMVLIIGNLLFIFRDFIKKYIPQMYNSAIGRKIETANSKLVIIPTILIAAFAIYMILRLDLCSSEYLHYSIGLWVGIIALFAHSFIYKGKVADVENISQSQPMQQPINNVQPQQPVYNNTNNGVDYTKVTSTIGADPNNGKWTKTKFNGSSNSNSWINLNDYVFNINEESTNGGILYTGTIDSKKLASAMAQTDSSIDLDSIVSDDINISIFVNSNNYIETMNYTMEIMGIKEEVEIYYKGFNTSSSIEIPSEVK